MFNDLDSDCSEEIDEELVAAEQRAEEKRRQEALKIKCTQFEEIEINSFDGVENGLEEASVVGQD